MLNKKYKVAILGLGYVGHSLFQSIKKKGIKIIGFDISKNKITSLKKKFKYKNIISTNHTILQNSNIYLVCVPTPVSKNKKPDLRPLISACKILAKYLKKNDIVIFESTVYPGVTRNICAPHLLPKNINMKDKNFYFGYSPERYSPGEKRNIEDITKIVSGENLNISKKIKKFYSKFIKNIHLTNSIEEAELVKNFENCQRDHNIALMNQLSILCEKNNIDIDNIVDACKTKWNFNAYKPGLVGGHCISVDPYYLIEYSKKSNFKFSSLELSRKINEDFITYNKNKISKFFDKYKIKTKDKILFIGATYKKNVDDLRNSGAFKIINFFKKKYTNIKIFDPLVNQNKISKLNNYKAIVIFVLHDIVARDKNLIKNLKNNNKVLDLTF
jgi:UDP-N-acetyl-D-glucosamine/UDP-N-acetyl-D-galactosamine dehydrogenase